VAAIVRHFDEKVAADRLGQPSPFVLATGWELHEHRLDALDFR